MGSLLGTENARKDGNVVDVVSGTVWQFSESVALTERGEARARDDDCEGPSRGHVCRYKVG